MIFPMASPESASPVGAGRPAGGVTTMAPIGNVTTTTPSDRVSLMPTDTNADAEYARNSTADRGGGGGDDAAASTRWGLNWLPGWLSDTEWEDKDQEFTNPAYFYLPATAKPISVYRYISNFYQSNKHFALSKPPELFGPEFSCKRMCVREYVREGGSELMCVREGMTD
eukprot:GHVU01021659.1.p1 GENE.GHVU01021659.1~~GHVU01021659.1.p1  ORF type:complete len:169 (-),score=25.45 GHVU01021659.1:837-1343(-)